MSEWVLSFILGINIFHNMLFGYQTAMLESDNTSNNIIKSHFNNKTNGRQDLHFPFCFLMHLRKKPNSEQVHNVFMKRDCLQRE